MMEFWIDRGGTFTDIIAHKAGTPLKALKLLSNSDAYEDAASEGVRRMLGLKSDEAIQEGRVSSVKMGTTVATNALLELDGAKTVFLVTKGFKDILTIGDQGRADLFALEIKRPAPLQARTIEIDERIGVEGDIITALDDTPVQAALEKAKADGFQSIAIALINSYVNNEHELRLLDLAKSAGFEHITVSSEASPLIKFVPRASTAVIDAYLEPVLRDYVGRVDQGLPDTALYFMQSSGGLSDVNHFHARNAVLSGPAGGVVGMAMTAKADGFDKVIGFDMGGTSTDVSRFDGVYYARTDLADLDGRKLRAPMLSVHTVAAGGGSVLEFDGERARVGPKSAGAQPGPACYGLDGPAALTDANVVLGRVQARWFPKVFGPKFDAALDVAAARTRLQSLADLMGLSSAEDAAEGFLSVAVEAMADAIKKISTSEGIDPRGYALNAFGGAGGQHACKVAEVLGIRTALIHPQAGLLSAYGIGLAPIRASQDASIEAMLSPDSWAKASEIIETLKGDVEADIAAQGGLDITLSGFARLRSDGSDTAISVPFTKIETMIEAFGNAHAQLFGFAHGHDGLVLDSLSVEGEGAPVRGDDFSGDQVLAEAQAPALGQVQVFHGGQWLDADVFAFQSLGSEQTLTGPALIIDDNQTIVLDPGWTAKRRPSGMLVMTHTEATGQRQQSKLDRDPVTLELYNRRFMSIAEQMGVVLERTAHSVNMKERLDFSCAVFDSQGGLVANAPHMPVHLGSMAASVQAALKAHPDMGKGDAIALNAPYNGGTHLPDITVIQPVFSDEGERIFFVAARGHHADVGGIAPGSMPPFSRTIEDEGVIFDCVKLLDQGVFDHDRVMQALEQGPHPARRPDQNIADLKAQLAACARGIQALHALIDTDGLDTVRAYMAHVQDNAESSVRRLISALNDGHAEMEMEDGSVIKVAITVDHENSQARIDFTGTSAQLESNFNAPSSVARAAVLYVLRCLVDDDIPMNEGCLKPITLIIPEGCLLSPKHPAAVVAGNVETSQLVVDALFAATGRLAAAQGTMNNFTFGDATRQYYETICGGAGAGIKLDGHGFDGSSAIHTHMTNSRLTDPEVLELRYPVRLLAHEVRENSGGTGTFHGGDGSRRVFEFKETLTVSLLSGRRRVAPPGLHGGRSGQGGHQFKTGLDGDQKLLPANFSIGVKSGEIIVIETPGGGGLNQQLDEK